VTSRAQSEELQAGSLEVVFAACTARANGRVVPLTRLGYRFSPITTDAVTPEEVVASSPPDEARSVL
jgi:hypothetical protein